MHSAFGSATKTRQHESQSARTKLFSCFRGFVAISLTMGSAALLAQGRPQPGIKLPMAQVEAQMFHVSAGKRLKPAA